MIAEVVIDIPAQQTNRPFDYAIPDDLIQLVQPGMRVVVPFGRFGRQRQGFIWRLKKTSTFSGKLKTITKILDLKPVLNQELLDLAAWLAQSTFSFLISSLQIMLPNALRAHYQRQFKLTAPLAAQSPLHPLLDSPTSGKLPAQMTPEMLREVRLLQKQQKLQIQQHISQATRIKKQFVYRSLLSSAKAKAIQATLRANATQQQQLLHFIQKQAGFSGTQKQWQQALPSLSHAALQHAVAKKWVAKTQEETYRKPQTSVATTQVHDLTDEQKVAIKTMSSAVSKHQQASFLLEGITGSGKTEVYLHVIQQALDQGRTALMLVPEISLTPQMVARVRERFQNQVAVLHSGLSAGERFDEWRRIMRQQAQVVVGARSAAFAPLQNIGVMILDEEHESSYKQEDMPRYHAREVLLQRAQTHHCPVIMGSATPSLESRARAQKGVYHLVTLTKRPQQAQLPQVQILDMRQEAKYPGKTSFSLKLVQQLKKRLENHEQSLLLLNRRGYANFILCRDCGYVLKCPNCDISLTLHRDIQALKCHYCGHEESIPQRCPHCHSNHIRDFGVGTQQIERQLQELLPKARILRMDVDTTRNKGQHQRIIRDFSQKKADILLGTQMVAKGLDFPNVTLVGVINADTSLSLPDFRASERTFQLLTQVSGRAGRADKAGHVLIQTFNPDNYAIKLAAKQDYEAFYRREMYLRHKGGYPPYYFTILVSVNHAKEDAAAQKCYQLYRQLKPILSTQAKILGPVPRMVAKINNQYYYQFIIKYKYEPRLMTALQKLLKTMQHESGFQLRIDREPLQLS